MTDKLHCSILTLLTSASLLLAACGKDEPRAPTAAAPAAVAQQIAQIDQQVKQQPSGVAAGRTVRGTITTTIDGQAQRWDITTLADTSRTSAGMVTESGSYKSLTLWGEASGETPAATGSFQLNLGYSGELSGTTTFNSTEALWIVNKGFMPPHWIGRRDNVRITLTQAQFDGQKGRVEGSFSGLLCLREQVTTPPDENNCQSVEGTFASDLALEEL